MAIRFSSLGSGSVWRILSIKVLLTSATVLSMAVLMKASVPAIADFVISEAPSVYGFMNSWLSPLYLYIFVNCIIISIVASSKFQRTVEEVPPVSPPSPAESVKAFGGDVQVVSESATHDPGSPPLGWSGTFYDESWRKDEEKEYGGEEKGALDGESNKLDGDEVEVLRPAKVPERNDSTELLFMNIDEEEEEEKKKKKKKSPVSGRFPASKSAKYSFEADRPLGVSKSKPKRHDTLESTWKKITDGRAVPLTRHLKKSDTWVNRLCRNNENTPPPPRVKKSENFNDGCSDGAAAAKCTTTPSRKASGKLRREASSGQDELNRRVEAFIRKFNEEMRLQRQASLNQYQEMIQPGAA